MLHPVRAPLVASIALAIAATGGYAVAHAVGAHPALTFGLQTDDRSEIFRMAIRPGRKKATELPETVNSGIDPSLFGQTPGILQNENEYPFSINGLKKARLTAKYQQKIASTAKIATLRIYLKTDRKGLQNVKALPPCWVCNNHIWGAGMSTAADVIVNVSTTPGLMAALASASAGTVIVLAPGSYGLNLSDMTFPGEVTITSADPGSASFNYVSLANVDNLTFDGVTVDYQALIGDPNHVRVVQVDQSSNITFRNTIFDGDIAQGVDAVSDGYGTGYGIVVDDSSNITLENSTFFSWMRAGVFNGVSGLNINNNEIYDIRSDGFDFFMVNDVIIDSNYFHDFRLSTASGDHSDMIQFFSTNATAASENITITNNVLNSAAGSATQSIFMRNEAVDVEGGGLDLYYRNIVIEDNVIFNAHKHGITVGDSDGLTIRNNTILHNYEGGFGSLVNVPTINLSSQYLNAVISDNIVPRFDLVSNSNLQASNNLIVQRQYPDGANYYGDLFVNALADGSAGIDDLRAIPGGVIGVQGVGSSLTSFDPNPPYPTGFILDDAGDGLNRLGHSFDATNLFGPDGLIVAEGAAVSWDFGDGNSGTGITAAHAYDSPGTYAVRADIVLSDGSSFSVSRTIHVETPVALMTNFNGNVDDISAIPNASGQSASVGFEPGQDGQAIRLNGGLVSYDATSEFFRNSEFSVMFDFKKDAPHQAGRVINFSSSFVIIVDADGIKARVETSAASEWLVVGSVGVNDVDWHNVAVTFSGETGFVDIYLDGARVSRMGGFDDGVQVGSVAQDFIIGDPTGNSFPGLIDNVMFLRGALSADQIGSGLSVDEILSSTVSPDPLIPPVDDVPPVDGGDGTGGDPDHSLLDIPGMIEPETIDTEAVFGTARRDKLNGSDLDDEMHGLQGNDRLKGGSGNDELFGGSGRDKLTGGAGADMIDGGAGHDKLVAGSGNDVLIGGAGNDKMMGGAGSDQFQFGTGSGRDKIVDFNPLEDAIELQGLGFLSVADVIDAALEGRKGVKIALDEFGSELQVKNIRLDDLDDTNISLIA